MYLRIAAFKNKKDDPLACMTEGEGQEIAAALAALTASCLEMWVKDIPDDKKEDAREEFYEIFLNDIKKHKNDKKMYQDRKGEE